MRQLKAMIAVTWISVLVAGCSTNAPLQEMSKDGKSTAELMRQGLPESKSTEKEIKQPLFTQSYNPYTRDVMTETQMLFPLLPNPNLLMYVYPHISSSGVPVPGYATSFKLYATDQYALPGER